MASPIALEMVLTARDDASAVLHAAIGVIGSELVGALSDAAHAAATEDAIFARLEQAYVNAGRTGGELADAQAEIADRANQLGFSQSKQAESLANLITVTHNSEKALELEALAMDVARAKGLDLDTATSILERTLNGNANAAERYGFAIRNGSSATSALAQIQQQAAGQAEAYGETNAAAIDRQTNALDDFRAGIGEWMGPAGVMITMLPGISTGFELIGASASTVALPALGAISTFVRATLIPTLVALDLTLAPILALLAVFAGAAVVGGEAASLVMGKGLFNPLDSLPHFDAGGIVPGARGQPVPILAHGGERVISNGGGGDINLNFDGAHIYGMADFETQVATAVRNVKERGGFRGVLA